MEQVATTVNLENIWYQLKAVFWSLKMKSFSPQILKIFWNITYSQCAKGNIDMSVSRWLFF